MTLMTTMSDVFQIVLITGVVSIISGFGIGSYLTSKYFKRKDKKVEP